MEIQGRVIEVRTDNEIVVEITKKQDQYNEGDVILVSYLGYYYWVASEEVNSRRHDDTPEYNDKIEFSYFQENVGEKDGYTYISTLNVQNYPDDYEAE